MGAVRIDLVMGEKKNNSKMTTTVVSHCKARYSRVHVCQSFAS